MDFFNVLGKENRTYYMGIAMLWIIGYHLWLHDMSFYDTSFKLFSHIFKFGYVGVDIFFFLSAYGLCHSYSNSSWKSFYFKRFVRIVPLFVIYKIFCFAIGGGDFLQFLQYGLLQLSTITVIPYFCPKAISQDWFVPAILNFYIIFPLLFKLAAKIYSKNNLWHILFLLGLYYGAHFLWGYIDGLYITRLPIALAGIFTYFYLKDKAYNKLILLYAIFGMQLFFIERHNLMYSAPVPLILYTLSIANFNINDNVLINGINKVGEWSFEFFFSHGFAGMLYKGDNLLYFYIVFIIITIVLGTILHIINKNVSKILLRHCPQ